MVLQENAYSAVKYATLSIMAVTVIWLLPLWTWGTTFFLVQQSTFVSSYSLHHVHDKIQPPILGRIKLTGKRYSRTSLPFILFNVLPKTGSRTLTIIAEEIAERRHGVIVTDTMALPNETRLNKIERILNNSRPTFIYSHEPYRDLSHGREGRVKYISIVRDPIDRLVSLHYYKRYGDDTGDDPFKQRMRSLNLSKDTFDECVLRRGDCVSKAQLRKTLLQFCGDKHGRPWHSECLSNAKRVIKQKYTVVGITEDYLGFVQVLEKLIPEAFSGATDFYCDLMKQGSLNAMKTKNKTGPSPSIIEQLKLEMGMEYELYDFIKQEFQNMKNELGVRSEENPCI